MKKMKRLLLLSLILLSIFISGGCSSPTPQAQKKEVVLPREFKTWKTIKLGTYKSIGDLSKALTNKGFRIGDNTPQILKRTVIAQTPIKIELVLVTVAELGFDKETLRDAIYDRAKELGLDLVPAEVGPQLRLAYTEQLQDEGICMAMEPLTDSDGILRVFSVVHRDDGRWLDGYYGFRGGLWGRVDLWVLARRY
jgi:ABC-type transport system substrate-binding protein